MSYSYHIAPVAHVCQDKGHDINIHRCTFNGVNDHWSTRAVVECEFPIKSGLGYLLSGLEVFILFIT